MVNTPGEVAEAGPKHLAKIQHLECWQAGTKIVPVSSAQVPGQSCGFL
jgi:hypothetical protein